MDRASILSLLTQGDRTPAAIAITAKASAAEIVEVPIIRAIRLMIERAMANGGLMLTKGGALSRADVKCMFDAMHWPDFDKAMVLAVNKVLNEHDVLPVLFTRMIAKEAALLRTFKGRLLATKRAKDLVEHERSPDLFRTIFETVFWQTNLAYFDRLPGDRWPQTHIGVVLWCLSVIAHDWSTPEDLTRHIRRDGAGWVASVA